MNNNFIWKDWSHGTVENVNFGRNAGFSVVFGGKDFKSSRTSLAHLNLTRNSIQSYDKNPNIKIFYKNNLRTSRKLGK